MHAWRQTVLVWALCVFCHVSCLGDSVLLKMDFGPGEANTFPPALRATRIGEPPIMVIALPAFNPPIESDHAGGDGFALRLGRSSKSDHFNWVYPASGPPLTHSETSAWVYVDWSNMPSNGERDYMLGSRFETRNPHDVTPHRKGYIFAVTMNGSWYGFGRTEPGKPVILKRLRNSNYVMVGKYGAEPVSKGWHKLSFRCEGSALSGYVDGVKVCEGQDTTYASGYCAAGYFESNEDPGASLFASAWDNLQFVELPGNRRPTSVPPRPSAPTHRLLYYFMPGHEPSRVFYDTVLGGSACASVVGRFEVLPVSIPADPGKAGRHNVQRSPTIIVEKLDGTVVWTHAGIPDEKDFVGALKGIVR